MNQLMKCMLVLSVCTTAQIVVFAGVTDSSKKVIVIKQSLIKSNQFVNKSILLTNITSDNKPDLVIFPFVTYEVHNDEILDQMNVLNEAKRVEFKVTPNAYMVVSKNGKMIFDNKTNLHLMPGATFEISDSATLYIRNNSQFRIDSGARLIVRGTGKIICENNSSISVSPYSNIILQTPKSSIHVNAGSTIYSELGLNIAYRGEGFVFLDNMEYYSIYGN
jgi:hypothetical protein